MCAVHNTAVLCISLLMYFPGMLLRYDLSDFETVTFEPIVTSITFAFKFQSAEFLLQSVYNLNFLSSFLNRISVSRSCNIS